LCGPDQFTIDTHRRDAWNLRGANKRTLHHLPFAAAIRRAQPARAHGASRRRSFVRKLPRRGWWLVAWAHADGLELQYAPRRRHARSPQYLRPRQRLRRLSPESRARTFESGSSRFVLRARWPVGFGADTLEG